MTSKENKNEWEKISMFTLLICFKKANSTLEKQKQIRDLWKIVKNDQSLYEKKVNKLTLKAAELVFILVKSDGR